MKKIFTATLIFIFTITIARAQFSGCYAPSNWTLNNANTNGFVYQVTNYTDIAADTDQNGNNAGGVDCSTTNNGNVSLCIPVTASGTISFSWTWTGGNNSTLLTEPFGYCINGTPTDLTNGSNYVGSASVPVNMGDNFCFVISSQFANSHPTLFTHVNINNFSGPCNPTGVSEIISAQNIFVASPFNASLIVKRTTANSTVTVFDIRGREMARQISGEGETIINTEKLSPGIYVVQYAAGEKRVMVRAVKY